MSLAATAIQPYLVPELRSVRGRLRPRTLSDLLMPRAKAGFYLTIDDPTQSFTVDFRDPPQVAEAIASDCSRFASAAFQSISPIADDLEDGEKLSWALIQLYYSAFYAGHAIVRLLGESYTFLDSRQGASVRSIADAQGLMPKFTIDAGLYKCSLIEGAMGFTATKMRGGAGGAHEVFWFSFIERIRKLQSDISQGPLVQRDAQTVIAKLVEYEAAATQKNGMINWLSSIRNDIQYRHGLKVWFPCGIRKQSRSNLGRLASQWHCDPLQIDLRSSGTDPLPSFVSACVFLAALCRSLLQRVDEITERPGRSFVFDGALSYMATKVPKLRVADVYTTAT